MIVLCRCYHCLSGKYNLCENMAFFATPPVDGSLTTFLVHPAKYCFRIPPNLTVEHGALCEPLSVAIHACKRAEVNEKSSTLILGCGPIGLLVLSTAYALGIRKIVIADYNSSRLEFAKSLVSCETIALQVQNYVSNVIHHNNSLLQGLCPIEVASLTHTLIGEMPSVVFDCAGFESSMQTALTVCRSGGKVILIGCGQTEMHLPLCSSAQREVDILGVFRYRNTYPTALELMSSGKVMIEAMITHRFGFSQEEILRGFQIAQSGEGNAIKVMFRY
jgi:L-iditol 2-dehydrogenase